MIKYEITKEDFIEFNKYYTKHLAPFIQRNSQYIFLLIPVIILFNSWDLLFSEKIRQHWIALLPIVIVTAVMLVLFFIGRKGGLVKGAANRFYRRNPEFFAMLEVELTENTLICTTSKGRSEYKYEGLAGLIEQPQHYFVMINKIASVIIPKNAITDKADEDMLRKKIKPFTKK